MIGPAVFPHYLLTVKVVLRILVPPLVLWAVGTALTSDDPVSGTARVLGISLLVVLGNLAILTLMFARIDRLKDPVEGGEPWSRTGCRVNPRCGRRYRAGRPSRHC